MERNKNDERDIRELDEIMFGIYSAEEIKKLAVCKVDSSKLCSSDKNTGYGTVYDPRMGTIENGVICETCKSNSWVCPGHTGYIELNESIVHPLHYKRVVDFLKCFCIKCFKLLITEDQVKLNNFNRVLGVKRFNKILEKLEKIDMCIHCSQPQPEIKYTATDNSISMVYKQKDKDKSKVSIVLPVDEIKNIFDNISLDDVKLLGFDPDFMHPRNLILTVFPVIPTSSRPYIISESNICDDDLTIQIVEIIKANNHLKIEDGVPLSETKRQKYVQSLKFRISTFYNNSCLDPQTPILTWDGIVKRADEIEVGDILVGDDGEKRNVLYTCSGNDDMYEIHHGKGDKYIVNSNHILSLKYTGHNKIFWKNPNNIQKKGCWMVRWFDSTLNKQRCKYISVTNKITKQQSYLELKKFSETIDSCNIFDIKITDYLKFPESTKINFIGYKSFNCINWDFKNIDLDPYLLGLWLGDGNSSGYGFTSLDEEIINYWKKWASENNSEVIINKAKLIKNNKQRNLTYPKNQVNDPKIYKPDIRFYIRSINNTGIDKFKKRNQLKKLLDQYNLTNNKHIPDIYLYNSEDVRLKLLAGFIDSDGHVCKDGTNITISQSIKRKKLLKQAQFLARSLGFSAYISNKISTWKDKNNIKKSGEELVLTISGINVDKIPTQLPRKKCKKPKKRDTSLTGNLIIKLLQYSKYNGFGVDKNHRFLLGDFTVTHNSGKAKHSTNGYSAIVLEKQY